MLTQMDYSISTSVSNVHALYQPTFSISSIGKVPKHRSGMQQLGLALSSCVKVLVEMMTEIDDNDDDDDE